MEITDLLLLRTGLYIPVTDRGLYRIRVWSMNETTLERQLSRVPPTFISVTGPLGNKKAWAIFIALLQSDEGLRFNQIRDLFEAEPPEIARALKALANAGLIARQTRTLDDPGNAEASFYVPTALGKALIAALYRGLQPSQEEEGGRTGPGRVRRPRSAKSRTRTEASPGRVPARGPDRRTRKGRCACPPVRRRGRRWTLRATSPA
jgi:DNA-binding MarR family transcriptional regulator